jgi:hypothetical protein
MRFKTNIYLSFQQIFLEKLQKAFFYKKMFIWWSWGVSNPRPSEFHIRLFYSLGQKFSNFSENIVFS